MFLRMNEYGPFPVDEREYVEKLVGCIVAFMLQQETQGTQGAQADKNI